MTKAIILLSGGLDSCVVLAMALEQKKECYAISFDYGQRHKVELQSAKAVAEHYKVPHQIINIIPATFSRSSLVSALQVPKNRSAEQIGNEGVPNTYVPARNTLFLAYALGQAEIIDAQEIHFGANALDAYPYPDCRPEYMQAFQSLINVSTKQATEGAPPKLLTPIIHLNKHEIIQQGIALNAPLDMTLSCYDPTLEGKHCLECDACILRFEGFSER